MPPIPLNSILNSPLNKQKEEASAKDFFNNKPAGMSVHIELSRTDANGEITITADINNQADMEGFMDKCRDYVPRKKWLGGVLRMTMPESIINAIDDTIYELTSVGTFVAVVIAGVIANNAIYYQTGLTSKDVDVIVPCSIFGVWLMLMGIVYRDIRWDNG